MKRLVNRALIALCVLFGLIQLVPYGRSHGNPAVRSEPQWDTPETRELAERVCFDCHSNQTEWPWYSWVAPASWLVQHDVAEAREHLNFSEWDLSQEHADDAAKEVDEGEMPLWFYVLIHPEARLTAERRATLVRGLEATIGEDEGRQRRKGR